jgi:hypothetical protein
MRIELVDRNNLLTETNREHAERDLRFALSRFSGDVDFIRITVKDTNGPRGGVDVECLGQVGLHRRGTIEVKQLAVNFGSGIPHLARRLARSVKRRLATSRKFSRETIRTADWQMDAAS